MLGMGSGSVASKANALTVLPSLAHRSEYFLSAFLHNNGWWVFSTKIFVDDDDDDDEEEEEDNILRAYLAMFRAYS